MSLLFESKELPGVVMNRFGVVLRGGRVQDAATHSLIVREALIAGWRLVPSADPDVGREWVNPDNYSGANP